MIPAVKEEITPPVIKIDDNDKIGKALHSLVYVISVIQK